MDDLLVASQLVYRQPTQPTHALHIYNMTDEQCVRMCRFQRNDLSVLITALRLPDFVVCASGTKSHISEALPIFLYRFATAARFYDMERDFCRREAQLKVIFSTVCSLIIDRWGFLLTTDVRNPLFTRENLRRSARAIARKLGLSALSVFGFIDGKLFSTCRPSTGQESMYNGKDREHGLKYLAVVLAFGLLLFFYGAEAGRRHDGFLYLESGIYDRLGEVLGPALRLALFGDSAFPRSDRLLKPFIGNNLTPLEEAWNARWCPMRVSVEWALGKIVTLWKLVGTRQQMKVLLSPVDKWVRTAALLTNLHTCFYGGLISTYFGCAPPSVYDYLVENEASEDFGHNELLE